MFLSPLYFHAFFRSFKVIENIKKRTWYSRRLKNNYIDTTDRYHIDAKKLCFRSTNYLYALLKFFLSISKAYIERDAACWHVLLQKSTRFHRISIRGQRAVRIRGSSPPTLSDSRYVSLCETGSFRSNTKFFPNPTPKAWNPTHFRMSFCNLLHAITHVIYKTKVLRIVERSCD